MRKEFEMSQEQYDRLIDACKPVPYLIAGGTSPRSPQENANDAWAELGRELGFEYMTVEGSRKGDRFFTAEETVKPVSTKTMHKGDPCQYCGVPHDDVKSGPCPQRV